MVVKDGIAGFLALRATAGPRGPPAAPVRV